MVFRLYVQIHENTTYCFTVFIDSLATSATFFSTTVGRHLAVAETLTKTINK